MDERAIILGAIAQVRADKGLEPRALADADALADLGMDSLDMATLVAVLDGELGKDPFAAGDPRFATVGELLATYAATQAA